MKVHLGLTAESALQIPVGEWSRMARKRHRRAVAGLFTANLARPEQGSGRTAPENEKSADNRLKWVGCDGRGLRLSGHSRRRPPKAVSERTGHCDLDRPPEEFETSAIILTFIRF